MAAVVCTGLGTLSGCGCGGGGGDPLETAAPKVTNQENSSSMPAHRPGQPPTATQSKQGGG